MYSPFERHFSYTTQSPVSDTSLDFAEMGETEWSYKVIDFDTVALGPHLPIPPMVFDKKELTVELWLAFNSVGSGKVPILGVKDRDILSGFELGFDSDTSKLWCYFSATAISDPALSVSYFPSLFNWFHFSCVNSESLGTSQLLIDGIPVLNRALPIIILTIYFLYYYLIIFFNYIIIYCS